jgi:hypothetical protein
LKYSNVFGLCKSDTAYQAPGNYEYMLHNMSRGFVKKSDLK